MKNKYKKHGFWKQRKLFLGYAKEIYKIFVSNGHYVSKGNVVYQILEQKRGFEIYSDLLSNSLELDEDLVKDRDGYLSIFAEESTERMDAGIVYDTEFMEGAALNVGKLVVSIHEYICLCQQLGMESYPVKIGSKFI